MSDIHVSIDDKIFSKDKWLEAANEQVKQGCITEHEAKFAYETWVKDFDGKKYSEFDEIDRSVLCEEWFE